MLPAAIPTILTTFEALDFADRVEWAVLEGLDGRRAARVRLLAIRERRDRHVAEEWAA